MKTHSLLLASALALACSACAPANAQDITLRFWALGAEGEVVQKMLPDFERENPGVHVRVQQIPWTAAHEKLVTAFVGDATPDVAQLGNTWVAEFVALNALRPLDSLIAKSRSLKPRGYFPGIWDTNVIGRHPYGVPWYVDTRVIFYRTDILKQAGYSTMPETWSGWFEAMQKIKAQVGPHRYAILLPTNEWPQPVILALQNGSPILKNDGRWGAFTDPPFRTAFDFYVDLFRRGLAPTVSASEVANVYQEFANGLFAMYITGPWNIGEFTKRLPPEMEGRWATAPMPGPDGPSSRVSLAGGSSLVMFRSAQHPREAWRLVEFLSRPEQQLRFYRLTGDLPARVESWQDTSLLGNRYVRAFYTQLQRAKPLPKVPEIELIVNKITDYGEQAVRGRAPGEALAALQRDVDGLLEKRRWMLARQTAPTQRTPKGKS